MKLKPFILFLILVSTVFFVDCTDAQQVQVSSFAAQQQDTYDHFLKGYLLEQEGLAQNALEEYSKVLDLAPQAANIYQDRARLNYSLGNVPQALSDAHTYLKNNPDDVEAYLLLASIYAQIEQYQESQKYLELTRKKDPQNLRALLMLVSILENSPEQALKLLQQYQRDFPNQEDVLNRIAALQQKLGQQDLAKKTVDLIIKTNPESVSALVLQAQVAEEENKIDDAINFYDRALQQVPSNNLLRTHLLNLNVKQKNYQNIVRLLKYQDKNAAASSQELKLLANAQQMLGQNKDAIENYLLIQQREDHDDLRFHLAYLFGVIEQPQKTIEQLDPLVKKFPQQAQLYFLQGLAFKDLKQWKKAIKKFDKVLELDSKHYSARFHKGSILDALGRWKQAEQELLYVVKNDTSNAMAANYLAYNYVTRNQNLDFAQQLIARALELEPENSAYLDSMGWLYYVRAEYDQSQKYLERAAKAEADAVIYEHLADCYIKQKEFNLAWSYFFAAQKLDPKNKNLQRKLSQVEELKTQRADALYALENLTQNTLQLQQVSGVMTFVARSGPAQLFSAGVGQAAFYLRRLSSNFGDFLQVKLNFPQVFPAVGFSVYYQTQPQEEFRISPPEAQSQIPENSKFIFEVISAFFNGDLFAAFDQAKTTTELQGKEYQLQVDNEILTIEKNSNQFVSWSLPDMKLSVEKYQDVEGTKFPKLLRLNWKATPETEVWYTLDIELTQIKFEKIPDEFFE